MPTRADTAQTMAYSENLRLSKQLQTVMSVAANESVSQLVSHSVSQSVI